MPGRTSSGASNLGPDTSIPDKLFFKIGEVSLLVGVQPHVLRYWEKEVSSIRPGNTASNQRRYRRKDVEVFREIRRLLYEEKFTLAGARKRLMSPQQKDVEEAVVEQEPIERPPPVETPAPAARQAPSKASQLRLDFIDDRARVNIENAKAGLRELIAMCGE